MYDDHRFVEQNPALETLDVKAYFTDPATASASAGIQHDIYRPLRTLSFAVDRAIFGLDPKGWHAVNLLLHALAAVLVLRLLTPLVRGSLWAAGAAAAVFAVHPVGVECVAWVSSRGDLQAVLLMLLALVVLEREGVWRTVLGALLTALACFAKESAVVLPALLLLRDLALPQTVSPAASGAVIPSRRTTAVRTLVLFAVVALYLALRLSVIPDPAQVSEFAGGTRMTAARGMLATLAWYGRLLVWPAGFPFDTHVLLPLGWGDPSVVLGAGLLVTLLAAGAWGLRHPSQRLLALATWGSLACLVPVSNVVIPLKALGAERFLYPVLVCIAAGVAWGITLLPARRRWMGVAAAALVVATLVPVTMWRSRAWRSDLTLWEAVLRARPTHMRAYEGLGWAFQHASPARVRDAEVAYRAYLEYNPADGKTWFLLGTVLRDAARSLKVTRPQPGIEVLGLDEKRRAVRREELRAYRVALQVWQRLGLVRGRGSPAMLQETWGNVLEAAWDVGGLTLLDAKRANDELLRLEGGIRAVSMRCWHRRPSLAAVRDSTSPGRSRGMGVGGSSPRRSGPDTPRYAPSCWRMSAWTPREPIVRCSAYCFRTTSSSSRRPPRMSCSALRWWPSSTPREGRTMPRPCSATCAGASRPTPCSKAPAVAGDDGRAGTRLRGTGDADPPGPAGVYEAVQGDPLPHRPL